MQRFAFGLRKLRAEAGGVTYRVLAARAGYSVTTLSQAAAGEQLPTLPVALAYVRACGGDASVWEARWKEATEEAAASGPAATDSGAEAPYKGLARFETVDHDRFFGRDRLTADLFGLLRHRRFAAVFGPSGSGKSSLLRAGLVPALQHTREAGLRPAAIRILTPGERPAGTHAHVIAPTVTEAADGQAGADTFLIVDQFEEVFTRCQDPEERVRFLRLLSASCRPESRLRVLIAVRADFYGHCAEHRELTDVLRDAHLLISPMSRDELREAIVKPATLAGLTVERALTTRLIEEVTDAPGGLPLLSHVLLETWRRRRGKTLTLTGYEAAGGLAGAIAHTAEDVYSCLTRDQADTAHRLLLRLVTPGDGTPDTRRSAVREELYDVGGADTFHVLDVLTGARLLTVDDGIVDLAHETLLTAWPRLRGWIRQERGRLRLRHKLTEAARAWQEVRRDPGALFRGTRLAMAEEEFGERRADLTQLENAFLTASIAAREQERAAAARTMRRLRRLRVGLSTVAVLALIAAVITWRQSESEERERLRTEARRVAALAESLRTADPVTAMRLSIASWKLSDLPETRSALMSAAVQREQDTFADPDTGPDAVRYLSDDGRTLYSLAARRVTAWDVRTHRLTASLPGLGTHLVHAGALDSEARALTLTGDDDRVRIWDVRAGRVAGASMPADDGAEISPSGRVLVLYSTVGPRAIIQLRDVRTRRVLLERRLDDRLPDVGTDRLVDISDFVMQRLNRQRRMRNYPLPDAQVSGDDRLMALCSPGTPLQLWDIARGRRLPTPWAPVTTARNCAEEDFQFTPDSRRLIQRTTTEIRTWEIASGRELPKIRHEGVKNLTSSPNGAFVAAADADEILLWRTDTPSVPLLRYPLSGEVVGELRIDLSERRIRYFAGRSQTVVRSLSLDGVLDSHWQRQPGVAAVFSPDAATLAFARSDPRTGRVEVRIQEARNGRSVVSLPSAPCPASPGGRRAPVPCSVHMAFRRDGGVLAYHVGHPTTSVPPDEVQVWDVAAHRVTGSLPVTRSGTVPGTYGSSVNGIAFHPDGRTLLLSRLPEGELIEYWNVRRAKKTREIPNVGGEHLLFRPDGDTLTTDHGQFVDLRDHHVTRRAVTTGITTALAYSADGTYLAAGDESGGVTLWDGDGRLPLAVLPPPPARDAQPGYVSALAFSPDGRTLATAGVDGTLRLWDVNSGRHIGSALPTAGTAVLALAFGADNTTLYASGAHVPLRSYDISPHHVAAQVCARVRTGPTRTEWRTYIHGAPYRQTC
ncbi:helix-turn-helix domain-containing protein [Streptomyces sp. NRRL B-3648]|uniref:nSTAND1 domain-containing NTPase n=1 Tax=Streptomyces sp. NRRL B-3648 TaxID=1519493 RepID=UPI000B002F9E|nr:helix-turn-helix domain-containing protein [Streptomyces sp. NRRL B-3648]